MTSGRLEGNVHGCAVGGCLVWGQRSGAHGCRLRLSRSLASLEIGDQTSENKDDLGIYLPT